MSAIVSADPTGLDLVHHGTAQLSDRLSAAASDLTDALDAVRRTCADHLGPLPAADHELRRQAAAWLDEARLAAHLAQALRDADRGDIETGLIRELQGGWCGTLAERVLRHVLGTTTPRFDPLGWLLPPIVEPIVRELVDRAARGEMVSGREIVQRLLAARPAEARVHDAAVIGRSLGIGLAADGIGNAFTRWAARGPLLSRAPGGQALVALTGALVTIRDAVRLYEMFKHHRSTVDKVQGSLRVGFDGSATACFVTRSPWACGAAAVTGGAWTELAGGRWAWNHRSQLGDAGSALGEEIRISAGALKRDLEGGIRAASDTAHATADVMRRLARRVPRPDAVHVLDEARDFLTHPFGRDSLGHW
ncbi:MAG: hypothetical protein JWM05_1101 [Acidimicrobiales bacterium]|nr:hypothetical protein [Acidimicrobiales bacterium]